ncbi:MAG: hypothetical protein ACRDG8_09255 [Actinomycetota bacterium]
MRRVAVCLVLAVAATAACSRVPEPQGPQRPLSRQALATDDLRVAGQARSAAHAFLRAYATAPADRGRALQSLVEGVLGREWAHWVAIQNAAFPGTIEGNLQLGHLGPAAPVRAEDGSLDDLVAYGVTVRATVNFEVTDETGAPGPPLQRIMDGLVVLVQATDGRFRVINFVRDGLRLDEFFQVFDGATEQRQGVTVEVRNLVQLERWQFGIEITNESERPLRVLPRLTALLTDAEEVANEDRPIVTFPGRIPPGGSAEGIVSFVAPATSEALDLQIALTGPEGGATGFVFGVPQLATGPSPTPSPG